MQGWLHRIKIHRFLFGKNLGKVMIVLTYIFNPFKIWGDVKLCFTLGDCIHYFIRSEPTLWVFIFKPFLRFGVLYYLLSLQFSFSGFLENLLNFSTSARLRPKCFCKIIWIKRQWHPTLFKASTLFFWSSCRLGASTLYRPAFVSYIPGCGRGTVRCVIRWLAGGWAGHQQKIRLNTLTTHHFTSSFF